MRTISWARPWSALALALMATVAWMTWSPANTTEVLNSTDPLNTAVGVSPSDALTDGQRVAVSAVGFPANADVEIFQCSPAPFLARSSAHCDRRGSGSTNDSGTLADVDVALDRVIHDGPDSVDCALPSLCGLYVSSRPAGVGGRLAGHHLTFLPSIPPTVPPTTPPTVPPTTPPTVPPTSPPTVPPTSPPVAQPTTPPVAPPGASPATNPVTPAPATGNAQTTTQQSVDNLRQGVSAPEVPGAQSIAAVAGALSPAAAAPATAVLGEALTSTPPIGTPTARVRPSAVAPGQFVTVSGSGFGHDQPLDIVFRPKSGRLDSVASDEQGSYSRTVKIPANATAGDHEMVVRSPATGLQAVAIVRVESSAAKRTASTAGNLAVLAVVMAVLAFAVVRRWVSRRHRRRRLRLA